MIEKRRAYAAVLFFVIFLGILSRIVETGFIILDKYLGDALYAIMLYVLLGAILVNMRPSYKFFLTLSLMLIIEAFQLSNISVDFSRSSNILLNIISILLGTKFSWLDIVAYLIGLLVILLLDVGYTRSLYHKTSS